MIKLDAIPEYMLHLGTLEEDYNLPTNSLAFLLNQESSGGDPNFFLSEQGARGPFQILPSTANELGVNPDDPIEAADGAARYLRQGLERYDGDVEKAFKYYHGGPDTTGWGPKTQKYTMAGMNFISNVETNSGLEKKDLRTIDPKQITDEDIDNMSASEMAMLNQRLDEMGIESPIIEELDESEEIETGKEPKTTEAHAFLRGFTGAVAEPLEVTTGIGAPEISGVIDAILKDIPGREDASWSEQRKHFTEEDRKLIETVKKEHPRMYTTGALAAIAIPVGGIFLKVGTKALKLYKGLPSPLQRVVKNLGGATGVGVVTGSGALGALTMAVKYRKELGALVTKFSKAAANEKGKVMEDIVEEMSKIKDPAAIKKIEEAIAKVKDPAIKQQIRIDEILSGVKKRGPK